MTQLIGVVTSEHALLVSDRRLTYGSGPLCGQLYDDDTCKLVNVANSCGIAYTGLAHIGAQPTHEWIADVIARENCNHGSVAMQILSRDAAEAFRGIDAAIAHQTFLMAGWALFNGDLRPYLGEITNCYTAEGKLLARATDSFRATAYVGDRAPALK